ncbi:MAG: hypothetical protein AAB518_02300 [Patescibacteria group bacterium]
MVMRVEKNILKVLNLANIKDVVVVMNRANLNIGERRALEEFYGIGCRPRSNGYTAAAEGLQPSSVCARRLRALRKMGAASIVFRKNGEVAAGMGGKKLEGDT